MNTSWLTRKSHVLLLAAAATFLWGSAYPAVKTGYALFSIAGGDVFSEILFAGVRFALAGVLTLLLDTAVIRHFPVPERTRVLPLCGFAVVMTFLQYLFFYIGLSNTSGIKGSILNSMGTFTAVILSHFVYRSDRLTARKLGGCAVGFLGVILIHLGGELGGFALTGEGFMLIAACCFGFGSVISKKVSQGADPMMVTGWQLLIGGGLLILLGLVGGGRFTRWSGACFAILLYLAFLSAAAYALWTLLLKYNPTSQVAVYSLLIPVFGTILSAAFLGENLFRAQNLASLLLVCIGIWIVNAEPDRARQDRNN